MRGTGLRGSIVGVFIACHKRDAIRDYGVKLGPKQWTWFEVVALWRGKSTLKLILVLDKKVLGFRSIHMLLLAPRAD